MDGIINSVIGQKNVVIDRDINRNRANKVNKELQEQYTAGFNAFAPLKGKDGKSAPLSAYAQMVVDYPELVGNGVDPSYYNLCKEICEAKKAGATEANLNERYAKSVIRK